MVLPVAALGPVVGPSQGALASSAALTAVLAVARTAGQPAFESATALAVPTSDPRVQPAANAVTTAHAATALRGALRVWWYDTDGLLADVRGGRVTSGRRAAWAVRGVRWF